MTEMYQVRISDSISSFRRQLLCVITFTTALLLLFLLLPWIVMDDEIIMYLMGKEVRERKVG
jgi:hypothetical protein